MSGAPDPDWQATCRHPSRRCGSSGRVALRRTDSTTWTYACGQHVSRMITTLSDPSFTQGDDVIVRDMGGH